MSEPLSDFARAVILAEEVYKPEGVCIWLMARNKMLGGERPIDLIERGEPNEVLAILERFADGVFA